MMLMCCHKEYESNNMLGIISRELVAAPTENQMEVSRGGYWDSLCRTVLDMVVDHRTWSRAGRFHDAEFQQISGRRVGDGSQERVHNVEETVADAQD